MRREITFKRSGSRVAPKLIAKFEDQLGVSLPKDYRDFLLQHNGGDPSPHWFYFAPQDRYTVIDYFHHLDANLATPTENADASTIAFKHHAFGDYVPKDCLIIGMSSRDNLVLLRLRERNRGQIALKIMDELGDPRDPDWGQDRDRGVYKIAASFSTFLKMLTDDPRDRN